MILYQDDHNDCGGVLNEETDYDRCGTGGGGDDDDDGGGRLIVAVEDDDNDDDDDVWVKFYMDQDRHFP